MNTFAYIMVLHLNLIVHLILFYSKLLTHKCDCYICIRYIINILITNTVVIFTTLSSNWWPVSQTSPQCRTYLICGWFTASWLHEPHSVVVFNKACSPLSHVHQASCLQHMQDEQAHGSAAVKWQKKKTWKLSAFNKFSVCSSDTFSMLEQGLVYLTAAQLLSFFGPF